MHPDTSNNDNNDSSNNDSSDNSNKSNDSNSHSNSNGNSNVNVSILPIRGPLRDGRGGDVHLSPADVPETIFL